MAQTKDELLNALNNISGPIESSVIRDLIESLISYIEAQTLGQGLDVRFVNVVEGIISGDIKHIGTNVGLYGVVPVAQSVKIIDPTNNTETRTAVNAIIDALEAIGITASV